jgi:hypothetical protein
MSSVFWDITPFSPFKINRCFGVTCRLHPHGLKMSRGTNSFSAHSSTLKMDGTCSSEKSVDFKLTKRHYTSEDIIFQLLACQKNYSPSSYATRSQYAQTGRSLRVDSDHCVLSPAISSTGRGRNCSIRNLSPCPGRRLRV